MDMNYPYLAGLIDGDGNIGLNWSPTGKNFRARIRIVMQVNKELRESLIKKGFKKFRTKTKAEVFIIRGADAINLLKKLKSYLILKRRRAKLLIKAYQMMPKKGGRYTEKIVDELTDIKDELHKLVTRPNKIKWTKKKIMNSYEW